MKQPFRSIRVILFLFAVLTGVISTRSAGIAPGETLAGSVAGTQTNAYTFTGQAGEAVTMQVVRTNGLGIVVLGLYRPDGTGLAAGPLGGLINYVLMEQILPESGTYTIQISSQFATDSFDYALCMVKQGSSMNLIEAGDPNPEIVAGQTISGHLHVGDLDAYTFNGQAGEAVSIQVAPTNGLGTVAFDLLKPDGRGLATYALGRVILGQPLPESGTYTILVRSQFGNDAFDYTLCMVKQGSSMNLIEAGDPNPEIVAGQTISGHLHVGDLDAYTFNGQAGEAVSIQVALTSHIGNVYLDVFKPDGVEFARGFGGINAVSIGQPLPESGIYTILIRSMSGTDAFDYTLGMVKEGLSVNLIEAGDPDPKIVAGQTIGGHLHAGDLDAYTFIGQAGEAVSLQVVRTNGPGTELVFMDLLNPDGTWLNSWLGGINAVLVGQRLSQSGPYTILVRSQFGNEGFDYALGVVKEGLSVNLIEAGDPDPEIVAGRAIGGQLDIGDMDVYRFTGQAGEAVSLQLGRTNGVGNVLMDLLKPDGTGLVTFVLGGSSAVIMEQPLLESGIYTVLVRSQFGNEAFGYTLSQVRHPGADTTGIGDDDRQLIPRQPQSTRIEPGTLKGYTFYAVAGDKVDISFVANTESGGAMVASLYSPSFQLVSTVSDRTQARIVLPCAPLTGLYLATVRDSSGIGGFDCAISLAQIPELRVPIEPDHPFLDVYFPCQSELVVRWPTNHMGFQLESTTDFLNGQWSPHPGLDSVLGAYHYVTNSQTDFQRFFRLRKP